MSDNFNNSLDNTFLIDGGEPLINVNRVHNEFIDHVDYSVVIPEVKDLDLIADLALEAYKLNLANMSMIPPEQLTAYLAVCEKYLNQAKDAIHKRDTLIQKYELAKNSKTAGKNEPESTKIQGEFTRDDLAEIRRRKLQAK